MTPTRKVLFATPLKGDIPKAYFQTSLQLVTTKLDGIKPDFALLDGPAVKMARNELANYALDNRFDELVFWDKDVTAEVDGVNQTTSALVRLLTHDVDIVCGIYSTRSLSTHWHLDIVEGTEPDANGLQKVNRCAIGFSKIKVSVFQKLAKDNPDRKGVLCDPNKAPKTVHEFFPDELQGKNTPLSRIREIRRLLEEGQRNHTALETLVLQIERAASIQYDQPNIYISEDYGFCDMARASGFDVFVDTNLMIGHEGRMVFPITTARLMECLSEPWRKDEIAAIKAAVLAKKAAK